jgi:energy-coupling factor transport system substrate-specific component
MYDFHNFGLTPEQDLVVNIVIMSALVLAILKGEKKIQNFSPLVIIVLVTVFCIAGRILLQPLPNVQPVTVTVILVGIYYRSPWAIAVSGLVALSTNILWLGHGPWTFFQFIGWSVVGIGGSIFADKLHVDGRIALNRLIPFSVLSAFAFDWIVSVSILLNHDLSAFYPYLINGLLFDVFHALGNAVFVVLLANPLGELMSRNRTVNRGVAVSEVVTS